MANQIERKNMIKLLIKQQELNSLKMTINSVKLFINHSNNPVIIARLSPSTLAELEKTKETLIEAENLIKIKQLELDQIVLQLK